MGGKYLLYNIVDKKGGNIPIENVQDIMHHSFQIRSKDWMAEAVDFLKCFMVEFLYLSSLEFFIIPTDLKTMVVVFINVKDNNKILWRNL